VVVLIRVEGGRNRLWPYRTALTEPFHSSLRSVRLVEQYYYPELDYSVYESTASPTELLAGEIESVWEVKGVVAMRFLQGLTVIALVSEANAG
jgi:hypothetical protein